MSIVPLLVLNLALGEDFFGNGWNELVEQDPGKYFARDEK